MSPAEIPAAPGPAEWTVSVVIATYNRAALLPGLLLALATQSLPANRFELVLVDDGSREPARTVLDANPTPYPTRLIEQENAGQAYARDRGVREASGDVIVVLDDDMDLSPDLLANHLAWHQMGYRVVLGHIGSARDIERLPLFERFHAQQLEKYAAAFRTGTKPRGVHLCTGNVSFRRTDYIEVGGFDRNLRRSEDRELGIRLELHGASFVFGDNTLTIHSSDHASLAVWLSRAYDYGVYDHRIYEKHPDVDVANPWRFFFLVHPLTRPFLLTTTVFPEVGKHLAKLAWKASEYCDNHGFRQASIRGVTYVYGIEYFRGLRHQAGSLVKCFNGLSAYVRQHSRSSNASLQHRQTATI